VGHAIQLDHVAPSAVGAVVRAEATLAKVEGRRLVFTVSVSDARGWWRRGASPGSWWTPSASSTAPTEPDDATPQRGDGAYDRQVARHGGRGPAMRASWKLLLRSAVSVVLLALLVRRVHLSSLVPTWDLPTALSLGGALLLTLTGIVLSTIRWRQVLHALGLPTGVRPLLSHYLAGLFVGNFLPSTIGGDVLRVARLAAVNGDRPDTFASVVLERLTGWLVLPMLTLGAMVVNPGLVRLGAASTVALTISITTLVLLGCTLAVVASPKLGGRLAGRPGWQRFAGAVHTGLGRLRAHPVAALSVLAAGVAYQLVVVLSGLLATRALDLDVSLTAAMAFMPASPSPR
jgi:hypothetical protein